MNIKKMNGNLRAVHLQMQEMSEIEIMYIVQCTLIYTNNKKKQQLLFFSCIQFPVPLSAHLVSNSNSSDFGDILYIPSGQVLKCHSPISLPRQQKRTPVVCELFAAAVCTGNWRD
jgi:hypothetical protein